MTTRAVVIILTYSTFSHVGRVVGHPRGFTKDRTSQNQTAGANYGMMTILKIPHHHLQLPRLPAPSTG